MYLARTWQHLQVMGVRLLNWGDVADVVFLQFLLTFVSCESSTFLLWTFSVKVPTTTLVLAGPRPSAHT